MKYDVVVIGGGLLGAAVARELSRYDMSVAVLEKNVEVGCEVTKGTHAIVHVGLSYNPKTPLKNRAEFIGASMMEQLCQDLDVKYKKIGKLGVAFNDDQVKIFEKMVISGKRFGLSDIQMIYDKDKLFKMEPNLNRDVIAAMWTPNTAIVSPWGLVYGLLENAEANGVTVHTECEVNSIAWDSIDALFNVETSNGTITAKYIINAAGAHCDQIARMVGDDSIAMKRVRQQKVIIDNNYQNAIKHVVRTLNAKNAMGDFITPTVYGDLMAGVQLGPVSSIDDVDTTYEGIEEHVVQSMKKLVPCIPATAIIRPFSGVIAQTVDGEFVVRPSKENSHLIHCMVGGSGMTAALPVARYITQMIMPLVKEDMVLRTDFNPVRKDLPHIHDMAYEDVAELLEKDPRYGHIICRCETVSEGEIVEAIRRGARTVDGVKFRTRAGMGRCQGGFCGPRVIAIIARELNISPEEVTKKGGKSRMVDLSQKTCGVRRES
ncbi:MAG: NAD(P)/FAD-dependent oxidoreductase [Synergistes sp.]|nr:NAD(P)/FAD-dependent oxidoreductase [Synergistes sp.]